MAIKIPAHVIAEMERMLERYGTDERRVSVRCWHQHAIEGGWQVLVHEAGTARVFDESFI